MNIFAWETILRLYMDKFIEKKCVKNILQERYENKIENSDF